LHMPTQTNTHPQYFQASKVKSTGEQRSTTKCAMQGTDGW